MATVILAAGPLIKETGTLPYRIVLKAEMNADNMPTKFIVHTQAWDGDRAVYSGGTYFEVFGKGRSDIMSAHDKALKFFSERMLDRSIGKFYDDVFNEATLARNDLRG